MANIPECYGLEFMAEDKETLSSFIGYTVSNGKAISSYGGGPYFYLPVGDTEFWASTAKDDKGRLYVDKFHTHCCGTNVWDMVCSGLDLSPEASSKSERILMFNHIGGRDGCLPVDVINANVLPSFHEGDRIRLQVVAQCLDVNYYSSQEEYEDSMYSEEDGKKWGIAVGSLLPLAFMANHSPENYVEGQEYRDDCLVHFAVTVKALYHGIFELGEEKHMTFIRCVADTQFGELEFHHSIDQVPEYMRENIRTGSVISGMCLISGDAAIDEYENGIVRDFDHHLRLLRYNLEEGGADRLRDVLAEECIYETDNFSRSFHGADEIIERLQYVADNHEGQYIAHMAEITSVDISEAEFAVGTKCIVLANDEEDNYESIVFIDIDKENNIARIKVSTDSNYHFQLQQPEHSSSILDDIDFSEDVAGPIIARAKFLGLLDADIDDREIIDCEDNSIHRSNAREMLKALKADPQPDAILAVKNIMGYLFAKTVEHSVNQMRSALDFKTRLLASYSPSDAFKGEISSSLGDKEHELLIGLLETGKQFGSDLFTFMELSDKTEEEFEELFTQAAMVVQSIAQHYSAWFFGAEGGS